MKEDKLVDIDADLVHETMPHHEDEGAFCVKIDEDTFHEEAKRFWLPKSQVQNNNDGTFTMPEWLAIEKGLV